MQAWASVAIGVATVILSLWGFHQANVRRLASLETKIVALETKIDPVWHWIRTKVGKE